MFKFLFYNTVVSGYCISRRKVIFKIIELENYLLVKKYLFTNILLLRTLILSQ